MSDNQDNDSNHQIEAFLLVFSILVAMTPGGKPHLGSQLIEALVSHILQ